MSLALAPLGLVLLVAGVLTSSRDGIGWKLAGLLVAVLALALLGVAWGLRRSAALTEAAAAERRLDGVLAAAARSQGGACGGVDAERSSHPDDAQRAAGSVCGSAGAVCGSAGAVCGSAGAVCGAAGEPGGCGARCLTRTPTGAGHSATPQAG